MADPDPAVRSRSPQVPRRPEPESGSVVLRIALGAQLRRRREVAGVSREDAAWTIRASAPKISRLELGRVRFKERDVVDLLRLYGVDDETECAEFLALARRANVDGWWQRDRDLLPSWFETYLGMEQAAALIRCFEVQFVPGLLQTEEYARAVMRLGHTGEAEVERRVRLRLRRQEVLAGAGPRLWVVLDEAALRRPVAGPEVTRRQLHHLLELTTSPAVTLQVAESARGPLPATGGPFTMLRFDSPDLPDVVYLEHLNSALYLDKSGDVEDYAQVWNRLCVAVEAPKRTPAVLRRILDEVP